MDEIKDYKVSYMFATFNLVMVVKAENIHEAGENVKGKYGAGEVEIQAITKI